jgi:hypothetical protein
VDGSSTGTRVPRIWGWLGLPRFELLFRQQFRRDLRAGRFVMEFAASGHVALQRVGDAEGVSSILILSDINMPGMTLFVDNLASDKTAIKPSMIQLKMLILGFLASTSRHHLISGG